MTVSSFSLEATLGQEDIQATLWKSPDGGNFGSSHQRPLPCEWVTLEKDPPVPAKPSDVCSPISRETLS